MSDKKNEQLKILKELFDVSEKRNEFLKEKAMKLKASNVIFKEKNNQLTQKIKNLILSFQKIKYVIKESEKKEALYKQQILQLQNQLKQTEDQCILKQKIIEQYEETFNETKQDQIGNLMDIEYQKSEILKSQSIKIDKNVQTESNDQQICKTEVEEEEEEKMEKEDEVADINYDNQSSSKKLKVPIKKQSEEIFNSNLFKIMQNKSNQISCFDVDNDLDEIKLNMNLINLIMKEKENVNLFESFFIFGVEKNDVINLQNQNKTKDDLQSKIIYEYSKTQKQDLYLKLIQDHGVKQQAIFLFLLGFLLNKQILKILIKKYYKLFINLIQLLIVIIILYLFSKMKVATLTIAQMKIKYFYFQLYIMTALNPNKYLYGVCFKTEDYFDTSINENKKYWRVPKVYCFVSYFPFTELFSNIIVSFLNILNINRVKDLTLNKYTQIDKTDSDYMLKIIHSEIEHYLKLVYQQQVLKFEQKMNFEYQNEFITYQIPLKEEAFLLEAKFGAMLCFSFFSFDDLIFILFSLLLENSVVFVSSRINLLSSILMTFQSLLKPFKWPHPLIVNLPHYLTELLESPVPIMVGINKSIDFVQNNKFEEQFPETIFVCLDNYKVLLNIKSQQEIKNSLPIFKNFRSKIRPKYHILNPSSDKSLFSQQNDKKFNNRNSNLILYPSEDEQQVCKEILIEFKQVLEQNIVQLIPENIQFKGQKEKVNFIIQET